MPLRTCLATAAVLALSGGALAQDAIRLNQVGTYPGAPKRAVVVGAAPGAFEVQDAASGAVVFSGTLGRRQTWPASGETVRVADFSELQAPGEYRVAAAGDVSRPFRIEAGALGSVLRDAVRAYYYQRASAELLPEHAGAWSREAGHPDTEVVVHASAASPGRPAGSTFASPGGWYDAGDYGKYTTTGVMAAWALMAAVERTPDRLAELGLADLTLPESGDAVPDVLDEALWQLRWLLTMQDPGDGGVYHKLTTASFVDADLPADDDATRYAVVKTSTSTFAAAAVLAQGARLVRPYRAQHPGLSDSLLTAARDAWAWGNANRGVYFDQSAMNAAFDPDITTGAYEDGWDGDEKQWAAAELFLTTRNPAYWTAYLGAGSSFGGLPIFFDPSPLGAMSLWSRRDRLPAGVDAGDIVAPLVAMADEALAHAQRAPYRTSIGANVSDSPPDFHWGSNEVPGWTALLYWHAFEATGDDRFRLAIMDEVDYLLGRNATGHSYVTGWGERAPQHPHHYMESDGVDAPIPGFVVGGPNPGQQDGCPGYPSSLAAKSYLDAYCSYATNEVAVNWQAALVSALAVAEAANLDSGSAPSALANAGTGEAQVGAPSPNPASDVVRITLAADPTVPARATVTDALGRRVLSLPDVPAGATALELDVSRLVPGVYTVRVEHDGAVATHALTVVR